MLATYRILSFDVFPWVSLQLLDTKRHLALVTVECKYYCFYFVVLLHEVLSRTQVLRPRHFAYVDKTFHTRSDFYKCTVVGHNHYFTLNLVTYLQVRIECIPWMWLKLLQAQCDATLVVVEVKDYYIKLLVERYDFFRVIYAAP